MKSFEEQNRVAKEIYDLFDYKQQGIKGIEKNLKDDDDSPEFDRLWIGYFDDKNNGIDIEAYIDASGDVYMYHYVFNYSFKNTNESIMIRIYLSERNPVKNMKIITEDTFNEMQRIRDIIFKNIDSKEKVKREVNKIIMDIIKNNTYKYDVI